MTYIKDSEALIAKFKYFKIKFFADTGDLEALKHYLSSSFFSGVTTNPSLMRQAGTTSYREFARLLIKLVNVDSISLGTTSDDPATILKQARDIHSWAPNIFVKIPIITSTGLSTEGVIKILAEEGIKVNVTAIMSESQVERALGSLNRNAYAYLSVFAGRVADTGCSPEKLFLKIKEMKADFPNVLSLWASVREVYNIFQAEECGVDIITLNDAIIKKLEFVGMDLENLSQQTVAMFHEDAQKAGYLEW